MALDLAEVEQTNPLIPFLVQELATLGVYVQAGRREGAERNYEAVAAQLRSPFDKSSSIGRASMTLELEDPDEAEATPVDLEDFINAFGAQALSVGLFHTQGGIHELRGEYGQAIAGYLVQLQLDHTNTSVKRDIGRCYRRLGKLGEADRYLNEARRIVPDDPLALYELTLVSADAGNTDVAVQQLEAALEVWADADPEFKEAGDARAELAGLRATR